MENVLCPRCDEEMTRKADKFQPHIHYEVCLKGHGVFFDAGEFKDYKEESIGDFFKDLSWVRKHKKK